LANRAGKAVALTATARRMTQTSQRLTRSRASTSRWRFVSPAAGCPRGMSAGSAAGRSAATKTCILPGLAVDEPRLAERVAEDPSCTDPEWMHKLFEREETRNEDEKDEDDGRRPAERVRPAVDRGVRAARGGAAAHGGPGR